MPAIPSPPQIPDPERLTQLAYLFDSIHSKTNASNAYLKALVSKLDSNTAKLVQKIDQGVQVQAEMKQDLNNLAAWLAGVVQRQDLTNELLTRLLNKEPEPAAHISIDILEKILVQLQSAQQHYWIQRGFKWDAKKFSLAITAGDTRSELELPLEGSMVNKEAYVIDAVYLSSSGTLGNDAWYHLNTISGDPVSGRISEAYYQTGSFVIFPAGSKNGKLNLVLDKRPFLSVNPGAGMLAQTIYGTVNYFFR